jgi:hypothetical protein
VRDVRSQKPQRINTSLKPHEALGRTLLDQKPNPRPHGNGVATDAALGKTLLDQNPNPRPQANGVATNAALGKTLLDQKPDPRPQGNGVATDEALGKTLLDQQPDSRPQGMTGVATDAGLAIDRAPDEVQAALPTEREAGQTLGVASVDRAADAAQSTPQSISEGKGTAITTSLALGALTVAMVVLLIEFLFRRTYAKRVVASRAMRLLEPPPDYVPPVDLSLRNQVEAYPSAASSLESVKKSIETIEEVVAEMTSSRQLRSHL